jgi:hypothetical protein
MGSHRDIDFTRTLSEHSDEELVAHQWSDPALTAPLTEMLRRHKAESAKLGERIKALTNWLLVLAGAVIALTFVLIWLGIVRDA